MNIEEAKEFINGVRWQYAKTYPNIPHEYNIIDWDNDRSKFTEFAYFILEEGVDKKFYSKTYKYLILDEYKYWIMEDNPNDTTLINRSYVDDSNNELIRNYVLNPNFIHKKGMSLNDIMGELTCK